jgi:hypothetical protein
MKLYEGERVLWPDGTTVQMEIRAAYASTPFCFASGVGGLRVGDGDAALARLIACYLRSSLAKYWLILTSYTASTERARVTLSDVRALPFLLPEQNPDKAAAAAALSGASALFENFARPEIQLFAGAYFEQARDEVDGLIFNYFGLSSHERIIVKDMVELVAESLQPTSYDELLTPLQHTTTFEDIPAYEAQLSAALSIWSKSRRGEGRFHISRVDKHDDRTPLEVVHINFCRADGSAKSTAPPIKGVRALLRAISDRLAYGRAIDFFAMPNSVFIWGDDIFVVKPTRKRFWTQSAALRDADDIVDKLSELGRLSRCEAASS